MYFFKDTIRVGQVLLLNLTSRALANNVHNETGFQCQVELRNLTYDNIFVDVSK